MDGVGEWATTSAAIGDGNRLEIFQEIHFPHSLGLLYSAFTYYTGFKVNSGEYKVMGLAPYGEPKYAQAHSRPSDRSQAGRLVPARHVLFRLLHRPHHDQRALRRTVRRARAHARQAADAVPHGRRGLDPGGAGGGGAAADAQPREARPARAICALPAAWRSIASPTARCCATASSTTSGSSRRRAMPAARWARRLPPITSSRASRARPSTARRHVRRVSRARVRASRYRAAADGGGRALHRARAKTR